MFEQKMENVNNKETLNLLDLLSETDSDVSDLVFTPQRKKKVKRRHRSSNAVKVKQSSFCGCKRSQIRVASLWIAVVLITVWLMALSWLAVILYGEMGKMDTSIKSMIAGSEGLPDAIQKCDSTSKQLQKNQSNIIIQLSNFKAQLDNFTVQMAAIQRGLHEVQNSLKAEPQLASLPNDFESLKSSVAEVGSQISDMKPTVDALKEANKNLLIAQQTMEQNITSLKNSWLGLSNMTQKPTLLSTNETNIKIEELKANVSQLVNDLLNLNQNFTTRLQWVLDDQTKNHKTLYSLKDETQNISTSVQSLRGECADIRTQITEIQSKDSEFNKTLKRLEQQYSTLQNSQASTLRTESQPAIPLLSNSGGKTLPLSPQEQNRTQEIKTATDNKNLGEQTSVEKNLSTDRPKRSSLSRQ